MSRSLIVTGGAPFERVRKLKGTNMSKTIAIIGGGVSGMIAAIAASDEGAEVTIFEHMPRMGKKLLLTGSGKCNLSNTDMDISHFHGEDIEVAAHVLEAFPREKTIAFFEKLGLYVREKNGYLYPFCEQASAVLDVLRFAIRDKGIDVHTDTDIKRMERSGMLGKRDGDDGFVITTSVGQFSFDRVIICTGSGANRNTGSDGSGYRFATAFGHSLVKPLPALTQLVCDEDFYPSVAGIRTMAKISLFATGEGNKNTRLLGKEYGQLQFTKNGISGICVFDLSHLAVKALDNKDQVMANIDLLPDIAWDEINSFLKKRIADIPTRPIEELFIGLLAKPLGILICKRCNFDLKRDCSSIDDEEILELCRIIKDFDTQVTGHGDLEASQVSQGGVRLSELGKNLESNIVPGLFFAGEILDVNGDCGGYNLQWAQSSGMMAGQEAAK